MDPCVRFENMQENNVVKAFGQTMIEQLGDCAPSDSFIVSCIAREGRQFRVTLKLASNELSFEVSQWAYVTTSYSAC